MNLQYLAINSVEISNLLSGAGSRTCRVQQLGWGSWASARAAAKDRGRWRQYMYHLMNHWAREGYVRFQMPSITVCIFQSCMIFFHLNFVGSKDLPSVRCEHLINFGVKNCAGYENATGTVNDKSVPMYDVSPTQLNNTGKRQNNSDLPTIMEPTFSIIGIGVVIFGFVAFGITTVILHKKNILPKHFYFPSKDRNDPLTRNPLNRTVEIFDV